MSWKGKVSTAFGAESIVNASFLHAVFVLQPEEIFVQQTVFVQTSSSRISFLFFPNFRGKGGETELANMLQSCLMP